MSPPLIALVGSPNSGKTTLFNALTGLRGKVGNYPGVTVDRKEGFVSTPLGAVEVVDLPGLYSLEPLSEDERISSRVLRGEIPGEAPPDGIVVVADATSLERSLPFVAEVIGLGRPVLLALTMVDELKARGGSVDLFRLQKALGIPVIGVVGTRGLGMGDLKEKLSSPSSWGTPLPVADPSTAAWTESVLSQSSRIQPRPSRLTKKLDAFVLHPVLGIVLFLGVMAAFFQTIFTWAVPAMDILAGLLDLAADGVLRTLPQVWYADLLANGVIRGVGAVVAFLPQLALLFGILFLMEASGYMARAAFVIDRVMGAAGLEGRCFLSLLSSHACAVPGILSARAIPSRNIRLATILASPLATCSARLPVYTLLISAFIPPEKILGPFTLQGFTLMGLYLLGGVSAVLVAALLRRGPLKGSSLPFYLELPPYRAPSLWSGVVQVWGRIALFLRRAGTVILAGSVILWCLLHFPGDAPEGLDGAARNRHIIENSLAADMGRALEPLTAPLGFDWRINVGLIGAFGARELMISTLGQVYALEDGGEGSLRSRLGRALHGPDGAQSALDFPSALALLVFFAYALLCLSTLAVMRRETGGWGWPALSFFGLLALAWGLAALTRVVAS